MPEKFLWMVSIELIYIAGAEDRSLQQSWYTCLKCDGRCLKLMTCCLVVIWRHNIMSTLQLPILMNLSWAIWAKRGSTGLLNESFGQETHVFWKFSHKWEGGQKAKSFYDLRITCKMNSIGQSSHNCPATPAVSPQTTSILLAWVGFTEEKNDTCF